MKRLQVDAPIVIGDIDLEPSPYINVKRYGQRPHPLSFVVGKAKVVSVKVVVARGSSPRGPREEGRQ
jgi:hypothetical protein